MVFVSSRVGKRSKYFRPVELMKYTARRGSNDVWLGHIQSWLTELSRRFEELTQPHFVVDRYRLLFGRQTHSQSVADLGIEPIAASRFHVLVID